MTDAEYNMIISKANDSRRVADREQIKHKTGHSIVDQVKRRIIAYTELADRGYIPPNNKYF